MDVSLNYIVTLRRLLEPLLKRPQNLMHPQIPFMEKEQRQPLVI